MMTGTFLNGSKGRVVSRNAAAEWGQMLIHSNVYRSRRGYTIVVSRKDRGATGGNLRAIALWGSSTVQGLHQS